MHVGGLFAQFSLDSDGKYAVDQGGVRQMAAVQMAIEAVNNKSDGVYDHLLPNTQVCLNLQRVLFLAHFVPLLCAIIFYLMFFFKLELLVGDSKIESKHALGAAFTLAKEDCVAFIGAWASGPTMAVSKWLSIPLIDRVLIGPSSTSALLSGPQYSNFLRIPPSDDVPAKLMADLMRGLSLHSLSCLKPCISLLPSTSSKVVEQL